MLSTHPRGLAVLGQLTKSPPQNKAVALALLFLPVELKKTLVLANGRVPSLLQKSSKTLGKIRSGFALWQ